MVKPCLKLHKLVVGNGCRQRLDLIPRRGRAGIKALTGEGCEELGYLLELLQPLHHLHHLRLCRRPLRLSVPLQLAQKGGHMALELDNPLIHSNGVVVPLECCEFEVWLGIHEHRNRLHLHRLRCRAGGQRREEICKALGHAGDLTRRRLGYGALGVHLAHSGL